MKVYEDVKKEHSGQRGQLVSMPVGALNVIKGLQYNTSEE